MFCVFFFFFSSRRRHTRWTGDWSSDVCSSDLRAQLEPVIAAYYSEWKADAEERATEYLADAYAVAWSQEPAAAARRSEERRVGKECRSGGATGEGKKKREGGRRGRGKRM